MTVTGSDGAVPSDSTVMAVNESASASQSARLLDFVVPSAYASDGFPAICSAVGHACAKADANGAFVIILAAANGDSIAIGIIDPATGDWLSELLSREVPNSSTSEGCAAKGVSGKAVDIAVIPGAGTPIVLKQGDSSSHNRLVIGASGETTVEIDGCFAQSLAISSDGAGAATIVVASADDKILWAGSYASGAISGGRSFTLDYAPLRAAFAGDSGYAIVALKDSSSIHLSKISLSDGSIAATLSPEYDQSAQPSGLTRAQRIAMIRMPGGEHLGALLADSGNPTAFSITLFAAGALDWGKAWGNTALGSGVDAVVDIGLWIGANNAVNIATIGALREKGLVSSGELSIANSIGVELPGPSAITGFGPQSTTTDQTIPALNRMEISQNIVPPYPSFSPAIVATTEDGTLMIGVLPQIGITGATEIKEISSSGTAPLDALAIDDATHSLFVLDGSSALSAGAMLTWK